MDTSKIPQKQCNKCKAFKPVSCFYKNHYNNDGLHNRCSDCHKQYYRAWQKSSHGKANQRARTRKNVYGISHQQMTQMLAEQANGCAICEERIDEASLHIDHDHQTGKIRGLLCHNCNRALGGLRDDPRANASKFVSS